MKPHSGETEGRTGGRADGLPPGQPVVFRRLASHHLAGVAFEQPDEVVRWMGMVQAQDFLAALWAVGVRMREATEAGVEQALAERRIVRTWPARGTLHFVAAEDARWLLALLSPRTIAAAAGRHRQLGLEEADFARARDLFVTALEGGRQLDRAAMFQILKGAGIATAEQRGIHILGRLAQEGLLCFGVREGKQHRFALLDEWLPPAPTKTRDEAARLSARDEALAELARRYFISHGPASLPDFAWWSGLTMAEARASVDMAVRLSAHDEARPHLLSEVIGDQTCWMSSSTAPAPGSPPAILLPAFDEYLVGYKNRDAVLDPAFVKRINTGGGLLNPVIVIDGHVAGVWKRTLKKTSVAISPAWFAPPDAAQEEAFSRAAQHYGAFLGLTVTG